MYIHLSHTYIYIYKHIGAGRRSLMQAAGERESRGATGSLPRYTVYIYIYIYIYTWKRYIYIYIYTHTYVYIYIYIYIERERYVYTYIYIYPSRIIR